MVLPKRTLWLSNWNQAEPHLRKPLAHSNQHRRLAGRRVSSSSPSSVCVPALTGFELRRLEPLQLAGGPATEQQPWDDTVHLSGERPVSHRGVPTADARS